MKKLVLETTAPFQGLPELVAYDEGLFEKEGIKIEWADRDEAGRQEDRRPRVTSHKGIDPFASHGNLLEQGKADMYNACEWGNYCRVGDTSVGSRQVGRRAIVTYAAIVVRPDSPVYTPQQLAGRTVGVPFYAGTHYLALHLLEGFLPRDQIKVVQRAERLAQPLQPDDEGRDRGDHADRALHHARREEGLPRDLLGLLSRHRGRLRPGRCRDLRRLQPRGARGGAAHQRQQGGLSPLLHRLPQGEGPGDRHAQGRRTCARAGSWSAIRRRSPTDELQRTYEWVKSWGMLEETESPLELVNMDVQARAHAAA